MFEARFSKAKIFKNLIDALGELNNIIFNLYCSNDGIAIQEMDASISILKDVSMNYADFDFFRCNKTLCRGINVNNMRKVLNFAKNDDIITLKVDDEDEDSLSLVFETIIGKTKRRSNRIHHIKFEDISCEHISCEHFDIPKNVEYKCIIIMPSKKLQRIIHGMQDLVTKCDNHDLDDVIISCTKEGLRLRLYGVIERRR